MINSKCSKLQDVVFTSGENEEGGSDVFFVHIPNLKKDKFHYLLWHYCLLSRLKRGMLHLLDVVSVLDPQGYQSSF